MKDEGRNNERWRKKRWKMKEKIMKDEWRNDERWRKKWWKKEEIVKEEDNEGNMI